MSIIRNTIKISNQRNICGHGKNCSCNPSKGTITARHKGVKKALEKEAFRVEEINN